LCSIVTGSRRAATSSELSPDTESEGAVAIGVARTPLASVPYIWGASPSIIPLPAPVIASGNQRADRLRQRSDELRADLVARPLPQHRRRVAGDEDHALAVAA